ncbi:MAG: PAS domain S-box protein [Sphingomonadaceae bacterium]|jgi:diguanylate cyclase (GGDEF)-like protein/PAS domain S-box-containing protein
MHNLLAETSRDHVDGRALHQVFAVVTYGADGKIEAANYQFLRMFGYELSEVLGLTVASFYSKSQDRSRQIEMWKRLCDGEKLHETALWIAKHGAEIWLESRFVPLHDDKGNLVSVTQIAEDVGARLTRQVEERGQVEAINSSQAVIHFSTDGRILAANDLFLDAVGYAKDEVIGQHHGMFVDTEERDGQDYVEFWLSLARGEHQAGEFRRVRKDGSDLWLQAHYTPIFDPAGRLMKVVKYATDITQEKMRKADFQWQIAAIQKSNHVITFDMHGTIIDANDLFLEATGYTLDEVRGRHHTMFVDGGHAHSIDYAHFWNDLRRGKHRVGQFRRLGKGGKEVWLQATYNPIFDAAGKPVKVVKYASVVTEERLLQADHQGQIAAINSSQCVISFDTDGTILDANENFLEAMGFRFGEVRGKHHRMFVDPEQAETEEYTVFWRDLAAGHHRAGEYKRLAKDGREVWLQATYNPIRDMNGRIFKIVKYATDVTQEKMRNADYQGQLEAINKSQGVIVFALDGTIIEINENLLGTLGYERVDLIGKHHSMLVERDMVASNEYADFWTILKSGSYHSGLYKRLGKDGKEVWIQASYNPIFDPSGRVIKVVKFATDVSSNIALAEAFEEAKRHAHIDSATSLPNRAKLLSFMNTYLADQAGSMAVFYIDFDDFKRVNDLHGHHIGDRVLGEVADRLRRLLREDQIVARVGGDEFVIAAPGMKLDTIERFAHKLYEKLTAPVALEGGEVRIGLSVGIATSPNDGKTPDDLLRAADIALNRSKQHGKGIHSYYASELNASIDSQRQLIEDMRNSFTAGDFFLEYQPRYDARQRTVLSAEALVRWMHRERGRISPTEFVPLAEISGLIVPLGEWILRTACKAAASWNGVGVSVNLSPVQFRDPNLVAMIEDALHEAGLPPSLLELEITEGVLVEDGERALEILNALKGLGIKLAIDDFGTGYSSLSYLRHFPFDVIKIDQSFVREIDAKEGSRPIVQAIIALGKALKLTVIAEGVETNEQLLLLIADHCDEIQGYLLSRPVAESDLLKLLADDLAEAEPPAHDGRGKTRRSVSVAKRA